MERNGIVNHIVHVCYKGCADFNTFNTDTLRICLPYYISKYEFYAEGLKHNKAHIHFDIQFTDPYTY